MNKKVFIIFALFSVFILHAGGSREESRPSALPHQGVISYLEGEVNLEGNPAEIGQIVVPGALISTGPEGFCEVRFGEKNIFRILPDTLAKISLDQGIGQIAMEKGAMALVLNRLAVLGGDEEFQVTTPVAIAGVRGTAFFIKVESATSTYICACNGSLETVDSSGVTEVPLSSQHHMALRYALDGAGQVVTSSPGLLYHNDEGMEDLAGRIGDSIDWGY